ncbi:hypothetical protein GCM10027280_20260 [Micromonospora polyrhachis]
MTNGDLSVSRIVASTHRDETTSGEPEKEQETQSVDRVDVRRKDQRRQVEGSGATSQCWHRHQDDEQIGENGAGPAEDG